MAESRDVCQICYRSTSHKANPTVTLESKSTYDASTKKKKCNVCRQGWAPIKIAKDSASGRYVEIRIRPKIPPNIDYQLCKNCQSKIECPKGLECSFAHSKAELAIWNAERQTEPRPAPPINGPYQYQLCKHMINTGNCPYGQRCTFAHSEDEWKQWLRTQTGGETNERVITGFGYSNPQPTVGGVVNSIDYKCDSCGLTCTSMKQLEDHLSGSRHRQNVNKPTGQYQQYAPPPRAISGSGHFRRRPTLAFPINGYKMCLHIQAGRRCIYGDFCTFSHTQLELDEWNKQLQVASQSRASPHINRFQSSGGVPQASAGEVSVAGSASGLDDFEEEGLPPDSGDFGAAVRNKLLEEHKKETLAELETTCEGVTISEVSGRDLCLLWSQATAVDWVFEITSATPRALHSVTLFDSFLTDYDITGACLITPGGTQKLSVLLKSEKGVGILLNQKFNPSDKIQLRVTLVPRSGLLGQLVVFNFGSFTMVRGLAVHVLTEQETKSLDNDRRKARRKPDLFWEQRHGVISMDQFMEETDRDLPEFALPEQIERFIEKGTYRNVENRVTRENYQRRMHNLLYLEEYRQREDMSRYDLYDIEATPTRDYSTLNGTTFATPGYCYLKLPLEEAIFEGGRTVRKGDSALLLPSNQQVAHECNVEHVAKEGVVLKITDTAKQACVNAGGRCSVRFVLGRIHMRSMHHAVDQLDLATIFPTPCDGNTMNERSSTVMECLKELKRSELNQSQQEAITSMLDPACTRVPSLVLGPFGCGKTRTLNECIKLLASHVTEARILICTHSNSAANLYVESLHREWNDCYHSLAPMFRVYYTARNITTIPPNVCLYCKFNERSLAVPTVADLQSHKIVVATLSTSRAIFLSKLPRGHFTHIFIDEAAQALESEAIIPLCLATSRTKIVLAGDHMQMDPPVHSPIARKYGLHVSLLERLYDYVAYDSGVGMLCKTLLTENHRSHSQILELPSKLFYKNKLTCKAVFPETGPRDFPPIKFVGVTGRECQDEDSPSYYNQDEALKIVEQVILLVKGGLHMTDICVLSYYALQVRRIRDLLRKKGLGSVQVFRVDDVQGKEYRALLISTVRTCSTEPPAEEEAGFLTNPKMFNTAVTRAKQWLVVVGEPFTLCTVGENRLCWMEYIRCCQQLGSFDYTNADQFIEESLDYKIVVRQVLEKAHSTFFSPHKSHTPTPVTPAPSHLTPAVYMGATPQQKVEILRSKIKLVTQNGDESTIKKITDELLRMSVEQQSSLIVKPELFQGKVKEIEQVFRRAGPTAAILNSNRMEAPLLSQTTTPVGQSTPQPAQGSGFNGAVGSNVPMVVPNANGGLAALASDLPPYLRSSMESVVVYARWVDHMIQSPLVASSEVVRENILRQKANVGHQLRLVNEQIFLYREVGKLIQQQVRPPPQPQGPHPFQPVSNHMFVPPPTTRPPPQFPPPQSSQPYQLFSQPPSNPGIQTTPRSMGTVPTGNHGNSAFSYGVSALLPNPTEQKHSQKPKPIFVAGKVKGGRTMNTTTPLDAAISASSAPSVHRSDQELYVSDDELFTN